MKIKYKVTILLIIITLSSCKEKIEQLHIGVIFPLTGSTAYMLPLKNGLDLAVENINASNEFKNREIVLHYIDNESDLETSLAAFDTLEKDFHPDLYFSLTSNITTALTQKAAEYKVPLIGLITSDDKVSKINKYTFTYYQTSKEVIEALFPVILKLDLKHIGVFHQEEEFGESLLHELIVQTANIDTDITSLPYSIGTKDMSNYLTKLDNFDALFISGYKESTFSITNQLREINYKGAIMGTSSFSTSEFTSLPESDGIYVSATAIYNPNYRLIDNFKNIYNKKYNIPIDHYSASGFDIIYLLAGLLTNIDDISRESVLNELSESFIFPGLFGTINKSADERIMRIPLQPAIIENGQLRYLTY